jgi:hypothetical protein
LEDYSCFVKVFEKNVADTSLLLADAMKKKKKIYLKAHREPC